MDLYEYQARQLLEEQDIPTPDAIFAQNSHEVAEAADKIGYPCVIKAQVKIGHRGQAGGVKIAHNRDEAILESEVHPADDHPRAQGFRDACSEAKNILARYYVSISVDRTSRDFDVLATANGGTEVEEIAKEHPEAVQGACTSMRSVTSTWPLPPKWHRASASTTRTSIRPHRFCSRCGAASKTTTPRSWKSIRSPRSATRMTNPPSS